MSETRIQIPRGYDLHCHLRRGLILKTVLPHTARSFCGGVIMPNTEPKIFTGEDVKEYRDEILRVCPGFFPLMAIYVNDKTTRQMIRKAKEMGAVAGKVYPEGVTTGSDEGVRDFSCLYPVFEEMEKVGMVLPLHGENPDPSLYCLDREEKFLPILVEIANAFPKLRIVLEHITTRSAIATVSALPDNVAATITVHHMLLTTNDVIGGPLEPHNHCMPEAKRPEDREALRQTAFSDNPKFFFGSDSAPHFRLKKECSGGKAGVFNAPVARQLLVQIFEEHDALSKFGPFISEFGPRFYNVPVRREEVEMVKRSWTVPNIYPCGDFDGIVPFMAGKTLRWQVAE